MKIITKTMTINAIDYTKNRLALKNMYRYYDHHTPHSIANDHTPIAQ